MKDRDLHRRFARFLPAAAFACLMASPAAAGDYAASRLLKPSGSSPAAWVMADFNGDSKLDLASVGGRNQLYVQLGALPVPTLTVPLSLSGNRLNARDLDGDCDIDIVLETAFREPIAVWLNDGAGHFHQGDVQSFRFQLSYGGRNSLDSPERPSPPIQVGECPSRDAVSSRCDSLIPNSPGAALIACREAITPLVQTSVIRTRGPPLSHP